MIIVSFIFFLLLMTGIGVYSSKNSLKTTQDYILANRSIGPIPTALSAVSTCHSGFMFIGLIGFTYRYGLSAIWLIIAWLIGDFMAWMFIHKPLREKTEEYNTNTISGFISHHLPNDKKLIIKRISALCIVVFLAVYAAAQLTAGSKALHVMLDWPHALGICVGAVIVTAYSFSGGVRASIWTDVAQSILMIVSMTGLLLVALYHTHGLSGLFTSLHHIDPHLTQWLPQNLTYGFPLYLAGWIAFGFGVLGQPHIMTRPMSISHPKHLKTARNYYFVWYIFFSLTSLGVGLASRTLLPELGAADAELALPILATQLLPSLFVGGILAGLFSATISTADSQILTCSAAITQDLFPKWKDRFSLSKLTTLLTMLAVVLIALFGSKSVYVLVVLAWSGLAVVLGPLILCACLNIKVGYKTSLAMMIGPLLTTILWSQVFMLSGHVNEVLPSFLVAVLIFGMSRVKKLTRN
jgi:sodium/proline symporter